MLQVHSQIKTTCKGFYLMVLRITSMRPT